jgi:hypothetical protein
LNVRARWRGVGHGTLASVASGGGAELELAPGELVEGRPFSDPRETAGDLATLEELAGTLAGRAADPARTDGWERWRDAVADHLLLVPSWQRLERTTQAAGVGFFGQLRPRLDAEFPPRLERAVADGGARAGWLLAYLNVRFLEPAPDGAPRYGNLVVATSRAATRALVHDADHHDAVRRSPGTYRSIRIHRLVLDGAPARRPAIAVCETLYLDFGESPPWRAVRRTLGASEEAP